MVKIVDTKGQWATAIGQAFVAFGSIEHVTVACLREIPRDRIQKSTKSFRLGQRIDLLVELLEAHDGDEFSDLSKALKQAKALAQTRNLIAHNPLVLEVYEWADGSIFHREVIASLQGEHRMTLPELQAFANEAETLSSDLFKKASAVFQKLGSKGRA